MNILFYGNCQIASCKYLLRLNENKYIQNVILCFNTELNENDFLNYIQQSDIIITQHIKDNYKNKYYLSTNFIINNKKPNAKLIFIDSCYFDLYYFDECSFPSHIYGMEPPSAYHYSQMINYFKEKQDSINYIINIVNNWDYKSKEELELIFYKNIYELEKRYNELIYLYGKLSNIYFISIKQFIIDNYKNKLLFYTPNHPSNLVLQYICENLLFYLNENNNIDYYSDPLSANKNIIYKCVQKVVNFSINECLPLTDNENDNYLITQKYFNYYLKIGLI